jgi:hypothetical protein
MQFNLLSFTPTTDTLTVNLYRAFGGGNYNLFSTNN